MSDLKNETVLIAGVVNANNRMYSQECIDKMAKDLEGKQIHGMLGYDDYDGTINLAKISHRAENFKVENNELKCDIVVLTEMRNGAFLEKLLSGRRDDIVFRAASQGTMKDKDGVNIIDDAKIVSVSIIQKKDDSFKDCIKKEKDN